MARAVFEVRTLLEPAAVALSVQAGVDVEKARDALQRAAAADNRLDRSSANRDFHRLTYAPCGNPLLVSMLDGLRDQTAFITVTAWSRGISWKHEAHEHDAILEAIEAGDSETAQRLDNEHIRSFAKNAIAQLEGAADS